MKTVLIVFVGLGLVLVFAFGLVIPSSIIEYPRALPVDTPLNYFYPGSSLQLEVLVIFGTLCLLFVAAVFLSNEDSLPRGRQIVMTTAVVLAALSVFAYPGGSRDIFKNISDTRTLWIHHSNPLTTPPSRFPGDPLLASVTQTRLQRSTAYYGAFYYVTAGPAALAGGSSVLGNLIAFKTLHAIFLLGGMLLAGKAARTLTPGRELQAMVLLGWNPLVLYEGVVNAHNDLLMGLFLLLACYLGARAVYSSFLAWALSAGVKYATGLIAPVFLFWHWRNSGRARTLIAGFATCLGLGSLMLLRHRDLTSLGIFLKFPAVNSPYSILVEVLQPKLGYETATDLAQYICIALLGLSLLFIALFATIPKHGLFGACFWALVVIAAFGVSYLWPWYFLWLVPLGAALAGRLEAHTSEAVSVTALLTYALYPYRSTGPELNYLMVGLFFIIPAALTILDPSFWRSSRSQPVAPEGLEPVLTEQPHGGK